MTRVASWLSGRVIQFASALRRPVEFGSGSIFGSFGSSSVRKPGAMSVLALARLENVRRRLRRRIGRDEGIEQRLRFDVVELLQLLQQRLIRALSSGFLIDFSASKRSRSYSICRSQK